MGIGTDDAEFLDGTTEAVARVLHRWESNRADETDVLVAQVRALIPDLKDKDTATRAIYAHVRALKFQKGYTVDDRPETIARNREAFGMKPEQR